MSMPNAVTSKATDAVQASADTTTNVAQSIIDEGFSQGQFSQIEAFLKTLHPMNVEFTALVRGTVAGTEMGNVDWNPETKAALERFLDAYVGEATQHILTNGKIEATIQNSIERAGGIVRDTGEAPKAP